MLPKLVSLGLKNAADHREISYNVGNDIVMIAGSAPAVKTLFSARKHASRQGGGVTTDQAGSPGNILHHC